MEVKKQLRTARGKISFLWDEDARTWRVRDEPATHSARDLDHARTMVRTLAESGDLWHPGKPTSESA
jgi:hypothetical protein